MNTHRTLLFAATPACRAWSFSCSLLSIALAGLVSAALAAEPAAVASSAGAPSSAPAGATRVYTNADLLKYAAEPGASSVVTNSRLKAPLPAQSAPVAAPDGDWEFLFRMLDREREDAARSRDAADAAAQAAAAEAYEPEPAYTAPYPFFYGYPGGAPHHGRPRCNTPVPTNTFRPLDERGIRTPQDLWNESRRNATILRQSVFPQDRTYALVHPR